MDILKKNSIGAHADVRRLFALAITLIASVASLAAGERESLKLLTIGNSFADYPLSSLPDLRGYATAAVKAERVCTAPPVAVK